jgi:sporulation protein YlmC with PRC-barrel domain
MRNDTQRTYSDRTSVHDRALIDSDRVEGTEVFDPNAKHIGTIKRLVIDKISGRVVYTVASFGGFLGIGGDEFTIPWNKLSYDPALSGYQTDITEAQLKASPEFGRNAADDWDESVNEQALNDYYGSSTIGRA